MDTNLCRDIPIHDGSKFTWFKGHAGHIGHIEASDFGRTRWSARVYKDAADEGFYIRSHRTGALKLFTLWLEVRGGENELDGWTYIAADGSGIRIQVEND